MAQATMERLKKQTTRIIVQATNLHTEAANDKKLWQNHRRYREFHERLVTISRKVGRAAKTGAAKAKALGAQDRKWYK